MRLFLAIALAAAAAIPHAGAQTTAVNEAPRISQEDFKKLRVGGNVVIVDTRNPDAYALGHIPGAILLPLEGLQIWPPEYAKTFDRLKAANKPIVTYCA